MTNDAHVIEIDSLVLSGVDARRPGRMTALIEAAVARALSGTPLPAGSGGPVPGQVADAVVRAVRGGDGSR
jgi:hypothetical protein